MGSVWCGRSIFVLQLEHFENQVGQLKSIVISSSFAIGARLLAFTEMWHFGLMNFIRLGDGSNIVVVVVVCVVIHFNPSSSSIFHRGLRKTVSLHMG